MKKPQTYRPTVVSLAVATALGGGSTSAFAQDQEIEEITVYGIRGSLQRSMDIKRTSDGIVEAITAEDIGKFPDTNLAESLQRITGVSIDRQNNEGNRVTVRGFGPQFNLVTLNGRYMPSAATDRNVESTRGFNFAELASESVAAVEVFKTGRANVQSGGIGATINLVTAKPLNLNRNLASFTVKGIADTTAEKGDSVTPEVSGLFSTKFADNKIGVLVSGSYQERHNRQELSASDGWLPPSASGVPTDNIDFSAVGGDTTRPFWMPRNYNIDISDHERTRINGQLVLQFAPSEAFTASLDYTISEFQDEITRNQLGVWFNGGAGVTGAVDANGTLATFTQTNSNVDFFGYADNQETENDSVGLNLDWQVSDTLSLEFDAHTSQSEAQPDADTNAPNERFVITGVPSVNSVSLDYSTGNDLPSMVIDSSNYTGSIYDQANIGSLFVANNSTSQLAEVDEFRLNGVWDNEGGGDLRSIKFGAGFVDYANRVQRRQTQRSSGYYGNFPVTSSGVIDNSNWELVDISGLLEGFSGTESLPDFLYSYDVDAHIAELESFYDPLRGQLHPAYGNLITDDYLTTFFPEDLQQDHIIQEETFSLYTQFHLQSEFNRMPLNVVAGVRFEKTDVTGRSLAPEFTTLQWNTGNEMAVRNTGNSVFTNAESDYEEFLPNVDASLEFREGMLARFGYSRTITRPDLNDMRETVSFGETKAFSDLNGNVGNSALKPFVSQNFDLSWEWYYDEGSYAAIGYFRKIVENFIVNGSNTTTIAEIYNPALGPRAQQAQQEVADMGGDPNDQGAVLAQLRLNETAAGRDPNVILGDPSLGDPLAEFLVTLPRNERTGTVDGVELAIQHVFGDSGFGVQANATFVDGDVEFDPNTPPGETFALVGLSDSANFIAFYDKERFQARVAYNWRDDFLAGLGQLRQANEPTFVESYGQLDLTASYDINDNLTAFVEGINVTDEVIRSHGRWSNQLVSAFQFGPRWNFGVRGTFGNK